MKTILWFIFALVFVGSTQAAVVLGSRLGQQQETEQRLLELQIRELEAKEQARRESKEAIVQLQNAARVQLKLQAEGQQRESEFIQSLTKQSQCIANNPTTLENVGQNKCE